MHVSPGHDTLVCCTVNRQWHCHHLQALPQELGCLPWQALRADSNRGLTRGEKPGNTEKLRQKFSYSSLIQRPGPSAFEPNSCFLIFYPLYHEWQHCEPVQTERATTTSIFIEEILKKVHLFFRIITVNWKHLLQISVCQKHPNLPGSLCRNTHSVLSG